MTDRTKKTIAIICIGVIMLIGVSALIYLGITSRPATQPSAGSGASGGTPAVSPPVTTGTTRLAFDPRTDVFRVPPARTQSPVEDLNEAEFERQFRSIVEDSSNNIATRGVRIRESLNSLLEAKLRIEMQATLRALDENEREKLVRLQKMWERMCQIAKEAGFDGIPLIPTSGTLPANTRQEYEAYVATLDDAKKAAARTALEQKAAGINPLDPELTRKLNDLYKVELERLKAEASATPGGAIPGSGGAGTPAIGAVPGGTSGATR